MRVDEEPHQLDDGDRRMRVIELDGSLVGQVSGYRRIAHVASHQILQRGGGEEKFLAQT